MAASRHQAQICPSRAVWKRFSCSFLYASDLHPDSVTSIPYVPIEREASTTRACSTAEFFYAMPLL